MGRSALSRQPATAPQPPPPRPVLYLVSPAGDPQYGDELITRAWLDVLTELRPDAEVWLDCPNPGQASHLFRNTHPGLHVTDTLWALARSRTVDDPVADSERILHHIRHLGTPRIDPGLLALRTVTSIHLLGGDHFDGVGSDDLGLVGAVAEVRRSFGVPVWATGLGLASLSDERSAWLQEQFAVFDLVEVRDRSSAVAVDAELGIDDAFLALALPRPVFDPRPAPESMVLVQGDARRWSDIDAVRTIEGFVADAVDDDVAFAEAMPPEDTRYIPDTLPDTRLYSFGNIWFDGLPARGGQRWLTSRYHVHLLAAAAGASGTVITEQNAGGDRGHASLLELGTGWNVIPAGEPARPSAHPDFPARAREHAATKRRLAETLYPPTP